ncbi:hypothetical protein HMPREF9374_1747 [Desmospora sp. 8437]|nr:hypothetical protein HMPREF9374_1747 [Desmospora sp. 8437]
MVKTSERGARTTERNVKRHPDRPGPSYGFISHILAANNVGKSPKLLPGGPGNRFGAFVY